MIDRFINHAIYWACISPNEEDKPREPTGDLENEIYLSFGGFDNFKEKFTAEAMALFGSGAYSNRNEGCNFLF